MVVTSTFHLLLWNTRPLTPFWWDTTVTLCSWIKKFNSFCLCNAKMTVITFMISLVLLCRLGNFKTSLNKNCKCYYIVLSCELSWVIIHTYAIQPYITLVNGDTDDISRLSSPLCMLLLGHWNTIFNGFTGSQEFYKTLKDLRIFSWISDCVWECAIPPSCFIFLFLYFCLFIHISSCFIICSCSLPVCFTAADCFHLLHLFSVLSFFLLLLSYFLVSLLHVVPLSSCLLPLIKQSYHFPSTDNFSVLFIAWA